MRNLDDWRRIAAEAHARARDRERDALELELEQDLDAAANLMHLSRYWWLIADNIDCVIGAETAYPPVGRLDTGHRG